MSGAILLLSLYSLIACTETVLPATDPTMAFVGKNELNQVGCEEVLYEGMDWGYFSENIAQWRAIVRAVKRV
jgi:hypothetical protein